MKKEFQMSLAKMYPINLLEGEGLGLTYEHFVKWGLLQNFFSKTFFPKSILVAGLSQKYGFNLDFLMLAHSLNSRIYFLDERKERLGNLRLAIGEIEKMGYYFAGDQIQLIKVKRFIEHHPNQKVDLLINCEVLQQYSEKERKIFMKNFLPICKIAAFFSPNKGNEAHLLISNLPSLTVEQLEESVRGYGWKAFSNGFIDVPPFPPGIKRTESQRSNLLNSFFGKFLIVFLTVWANLERFLPRFVLKKKAHIVYILLTK